MKEIKKINKDNAIEYICRPNNLAGTIDFYVYELKLSYVNVVYYSRPINY